ncbi:response regulator transcription factor [Acaryochloris marina]|uniref:response regulator transcription factor n=1 Tax=Acaryochloris marina TaxID=155978 RepID=UPI0021C3AA01|nr:response regulator [Acaryochloris marina]BDM83229.1 hypothetical protein AM10699_60900 [Acaryochloris marina MBIC10699]
MKRILLVEDEKRVASFIEKGLLKHGYCPTLVRDGEQALNQIYHESYDLVLLDLGLPIISGRAVLQTLRQQGFTLPIIVLTAYSEKKNLALGLGADGFIDKPFRFSELLEVIQSHLPQE